MLERWNFTVCSVTHSVRATWAFECPSDTSRRISSSRRVRPGSPWVGGSIVRGAGENADRRKIEWSKTCLTAATRSSGCAVLTTKAIAPAANADSTTSVSPCPDSTTMSRPGASSRALRMHSSPARGGSSRSRSIRKSAGRSVATASSAAAMLVVFATTSSASGWSTWSTASSHNGCWSRMTAVRAPSTLIGVPDHRL